MPEAPDLTADLAHARAAVDAFMDAADGCGSVWHDPISRGKWSPAQTVEHVARAFEEAAKDMHGRRSRMPNIPRPLQFLPRLMFRRVLRKDALPRAKTNPAMNPEKGPADPSDGRARMEAAWREFEGARQRLNGPVRSRIFGSVKAEDYVRFQALHALHHKAQLPSNGTTVEDS